MKHKLVLTFLFICSFMNQLQAEEIRQWKPALGNNQIPIWPDGKMPDPVDKSKPESIKIRTDQLVAGKPWTDISDVSRPTITIYSPKTNNSKTAIIVFPGGGFNGLAIDIEGTEICNWLTSKGITCVLLKYRVPDSGPAWHNDCNCHIRPKAPTALQDAQRTIGLIRLNADKWHINKNKIGVIGFSAGGYMVAQMSSNFNKRVYKPIDNADKESIRPDFAIALYPGHMQEDEYPGQFILNKNIHFTLDSPPTFLLQAENDPVDRINNSLLYYIGLKNAGVSVELHLYAEGGHGFGLRQTKYPITNWPLLVEKWLHTVNILK
jgi:acetyl esterase/lipase